MAALRTAAPEEFARRERAWRAEQRAEAKAEAVKGTGTYPEWQEAVAAKKRATAEKEAAETALWDVAPEEWAAVVKAQAALP